MKKLVGKIKKSNISSNQMLTIYSKNLVQKVKENNNQNIGIEIYSDGLLITPRGCFHATIAANKRLQITLTKFIEKYDIKPENLIQIYLDEKIWGIKEVLSKSKGSPLTNEIPNNLLEKSAALRTNKRDRYFLDISQKKLYELAQKETIRCLLNRTRNKIILVKSEETNARKLTPHGKRRIQLAIPKEILKKDELEFLRKKTWLPIKIELDINTFGLKIHDFYSVKEEKELVKFMKDCDISIKIKSPADPYDIYLPDYNSAIEVHNSFPGYGDLVTRHKVRPAMVRLRILEAKALIETNKINTFFLILNKGWENGEYIKELTNILSRNIKIIYTDFKEDWYKDVGNIILEYVNK